MPKKKSVRKAATDFASSVDGLLHDCQDFEKKRLTDRQVTLVYDAAIIRLYASFEAFVLQCLVGAINNDTSLLSDQTGFDFPTHLSDEVCEYLVTNGGYFNFKGRDGLLRTLRQYLPSTHYVLEVIKDSSYKDDLDRLIALRNFAAHYSKQSKQASRKVVGVNHASAGSWLKKQDRFAKLGKHLKSVAHKVETRAPY